METAIHYVNDWINNTNISGNFDYPLQLQELGLTELPILPNNIKTLYCFNNQLTELPSLCSLTNLETLYCSGNQLTELPSLASLINLETLYCGGNQLTKLPTLPNNLLYLDCHNNKLTELPSLCSLTNLQHLNCSGNIELKNMNRKFEEHDLKLLRLEYQFTKLQQDVQSLKQLKNLNFESVISHTIRKYV